MKILMITPYVPFPPSSGGQIRTFNLLKYLSLKNDITLVCLYKFDDEKRHVAQLQPYCRRVYFCRRSKRPWTVKTIFGSLLSLKPFVVVRNFSDEAKIVLKKLFSQESFDVIHVETFYVMPHLPKVATPVLLVEQTIEYQVYQHFVKSLPVFLQPFFLIDIVKLKYWERYYWTKASLVATVSQSDKDLVKRLQPKIHPVIVPNGAGDEMVVDSLSTPNLKKPVLLFQGNFLWLQNTEAAFILAKKILPRLKRKIKNFQLIIAGQNAQKKLKIKSGRFLKIINVPYNKNYLVRQLYKKATLFIAPIFGPGGTRLKILAAMASGVPVVSTKTGISGLDVADGKTVLITSSPDEFVNKIKYILNNETVYKNIQQQAYQLIKEKYNWKKIASNLEVIYQRLIKP